MEMSTSFHSSSSFSILNPNPRASLSSPLPFSKQLFGFSLPSSTAKTTTLKLRSRNPTSFTHTPIKCSISEATEAVTTEKKKKLVRRNDIRNIAIVAHVDHGKTTLVDAMLRQSKVFRDNQFVQERIMDSNDLERERGITKLSKNTSVTYKDSKINIIDTPSHSDFGVEVEHILNMVEGILLLVDSVEGPKPQTRFFLKKAIEFGHAVVVVVNKIDRPSARPDFVINSTFELFIELNATNEQCDFQAIYACGIKGKAGLSADNLADDLGPLFEAIVRCIPGPAIDKDGALQMLVTNIKYDEHKGRIAIGRLHAGALRKGMDVKVCTSEDSCRYARVSKLFVYDQFNRVPAESVEAGDICAVCGINDIQIGETIADKMFGKPLPAIKVEEPTAKMALSINTSPFVGCEIATMEVSEEHMGPVVELLGKRQGHMFDWPQLLQLSIGSKNLKLGQSIHAFLLKCGCQSDTFPGNNLVNLYSKFKQLDDAQGVFDEMLVRNTITWTSLMKGYSDIGDFDSVFRIAQDMFCGEEVFNEHTCSVILEACSLLEDRRRGEQVHGFVVKSGLQENVFVATSLVSMYSRSGCLGEAEKVFNYMDYKDLQCLNYMILEYGKAGCGGKAIGVFIDLLSSGLEPNDYTFTNLFSACNGDVGVHEGWQLHGLAVKYGIMDETSIGNAVITMYGKHGMVEEAETMFHVLDERSLVSWTALLSMYVKNGRADKALDVFIEILDLGIRCDSSCLSAVLDACSECRNLESGRQVHAFVIKLGFHSGVNVGTALIDIYAKCGNLLSARRVFDGLSGKSTASFNAVLIGFMESHRDVEEDPMVLFSQLRFTGINPDFITFSRFLSLSAEEACLVRGKSLHAYTIKAGFETHPTVGNAVITMYAKCGSIEEAYQMFNSMNSHDCVSWNAIISAYALHGEGNKALLLFEDMKKEGFAPDEITLLAILQACSYAGLWESGLRLFNEMESKYGTGPVIEHFACMVDLLGRAGNFSEAIDFIQKSPFPDSPMLWRTLVNVCMLCGNLNFGMLASKRLLDLKPVEAGSYILVSNMYAGGGMFDEAAKVRTVMNDLKVNKEAGCSWIEIDNKFHYFVASDMDHPNSAEIYANLNLLKVEIRQNSDDRIDLQFSM